MSRVDFLSRHRIVLLALGASLAAHAVTIVGLPARFGTEPVELEAASYIATLQDPVVQIVPGTPAAKPAAKPRPPRAPRTPRREGEAIAVLPGLLEEAGSEGNALAEVEGEATLLAGYEAAEPPAETPKPEVLALAAPAAPIPAFEPPRFPTEALPSRLSIRYALTSAFADGHAEYDWSRDGDRYEITGQAAAEGVFAVFLEGHITQMARGTVTAAGLRPERFTERMPRGSEEGLVFDWEGRRVTFRRNDEDKVAPLNDNTVDWLSMIFQLAHVPPAGDSVSMQVFTQRKLYRFTLKSMGVEEIELPIGRVRAHHLRHDGAKPDEQVDVWLGLDNHNLPVKLRYPVARNRFFVEQVATAIRSR